jgi:hypothetical protein
MTITVKQFGFTPSSGALSNIVDTNVATGWAPSATDLASFTSSFLHASGVPIVAPFACIEFDYGEAVRLPLFLLQTESGSTLGDGMLIGSDTPATSTADVVNSDDVLMGVYTQAQLNAGHVLKTSAFSGDIRKRYYRLCQHALGVPIVSTDGGGPGGSNSQVFDSGSDNFITPDYTNTLVIELWGAAACGGVSGDASDGGDTTCATYSLIAGGGNKSAQAAQNAGPGGTGGTATGGNTLNATGGNGDPPDPTGTLNAGNSGKGGDAPYGGVGGSAVSNGAGGHINGNPGVAPGGGGSGRNNNVSDSGLIFTAAYFKYPGGGSGAYVRHVFTRGVAGSPAPGDPIAYSVGAGAVSPVGDGNGANGRARFSWD